MLRIQRIVAVGVVALGLMTACAAAADPAYYAKKATWQETLQGAREALAVQEAEAASKAGQAAPVPAAGQAAGLELGTFHIIGPFVEPGQGAFEFVFPPEKEIDLAKSYGKFKWEPTKDADDECHALSTPAESATYLYRKITATQATKLTGYFGSDDGLVVWLNGKKLISNKVPRGVSPNQDKAPLELVKGDNHLLIKIWNQQGGCGYYFSITGNSRATSETKDPAQLARLALWDLARRDFHEPAAAQQMRWEDDDNLWSADWNAGDFAGLARRYAAPVRGMQAGGEIEALAKEAKSAGDLDKVRQVYYQAKLVQETLGKLKDLNLQALRLAVQDLIATHGDKYPKGKEFLARLDAMEKAVLEAAKDGAMPQDKQIAVVQDFLKLRREALLANPLLDFDKLMVVKRSMKNLGLPQNWQGNCALPRSGYDNEIATVSMKEPEGPLTTLYRPGKGEFVGDVDLHFEADKMLFSSLDARQRWQIFEIGAGGQGLQQVTPSSATDVDNYDPVYLPDGRIIFGSTRCFQGVPCVGGANSVANLYLMNAKRDPNSVRQITFEQDHDWCPTLTHDGKVMYTRWEYSDLPHYFTRVLFSMNPDGTQQLEMNHSNSYWPNSTFYARPCPGHPTKIVAIISGHHGVPRMGELIIFDPAKGKHEADGVVQRIPGYGKPVEPIIRDTLVDGSWPKFLHPWPLSDKYFLVSCQMTARDTWDLYLVDVFDNMVPLHREAGYAMLEPVPLKATPRPPAIPDRVDLTRKDAVLYVTDVYAGQGLKGVPRGTVKKLRIYSFHYAYYGMGGHINIGVDGPWDVHRILGTVPVREDGSAMFRVPANTPIALQPLDAEGKAMQVMRSWLTAMPGEFLSCVGCHETQGDTASTRLHEAAIRPVEEITPWYGPARGFSFEREVQPVLDKYCVSCHDGQKTTAAGLAMPDFRKSDKKGWSGFTASYLALHPFVRRPGPESDYHVQAAMEYHADGSELTQMLRKGHGRVQLDAEAWDRLITWMDLNVPDRGTWGEERKVPGNVHERRLAMAKAYAGIADDPEAIVAGPTGVVVPVQPGPAPTPPAPLAIPGWPFDAAEAKHQQDAAAAELGSQAGKAGLTFDIAPGVKVEMVLIPAGQFVMGDVTGSPDEWPQTHVKIDKPFWMAKFEVTNDLYAQFDPQHDSGYISVYNKDQSTRGEQADRPRQPVIRVSWQQAVAFCHWLSDKTGRHFTLPTEAQWEYACRAGTATPLYFGTCQTDFGKLANLADKRVNELTRSSPKWIPYVESVNDGAVVMDVVGKYAPNPWGLHDMSGNVAEWTLSTYKPYPYNAADGRDSGAPDGRKVVRGGSFYDRPQRATSSFREDYPSWRGVFNVGFRVVCEAAPKAAVAAAATAK
jgi:formylglycine-generating enzyme required for sulfatase activity